MSTQARGTYALLLRAAAPQTIRVGALGRHAFPAGWYLYLGSAHGPGGLKARLARHRRRRDKRLHWHIDYLRATTTLVEIWTSAGVKQECDWAAAATQLTGATVVVPRFGASDCRCPAHLLHYLRRPRARALAKLTGIVLEQELLD